MPFFRTQLARAPDWKILLFGAFLFLSLVDGLTGLKDLSLILAFLTALCLIGKGNWRILGNRAIWPLYFFAVAVLYSGWIAPDLASAWAALRRPFVIDAILTPLVFIVLLQRVSARELATTAVVAIGLAGLLSFGIGLDLSLDAYLATKPVFVKYGYFEQHEYIIMLAWSLCLATLGTWGSRYFRYFLPVLLLLCGALLGCLARATWLGALVAFCGYTLYFRHWRHAGIVVVLGIVALLVSLIIQMRHYSDITLQYKLTQLTSSARYGNGTTTAAWEILSLNPWRGYGAGEYRRVYRAVLPAHPEWLYQKPIDPHNFALSVWLQGGILGLLSLLGMYATIICLSLRKLWQSSGSILSGKLTVLFATISIYVVTYQFTVGTANWLGFLFAVAFLLSRPDSKGMPPPAIGKS